MQEIAVFLDERSEVAPLEKSAKVSVFSPCASGWAAVKEVPVHLDFTAGIAQIRQSIQSLAQELAGCRAVVGSSFTGLAFQIFDRLNFSIFETAAVSGTVLNQIAADLDDAAQKAAAVSAAPAETAVPGVYFLDLIALQKQRPELSSKMALQSFLNATPYLRVDVLCRHIPPWVKAMAENQKIRIMSEQISGDTVRLSITKYSC